ncbi:MAG: hypothetical protein JWN71_3393 [Xanthobacteraceae bacterium]|nr:hypothetical protein [Xanthobacteraceae bacterium]
MNIGFAVTAGIATLIALICLWFWKKLRDETAVMAATPTSRAADVAAMAPGTLVEVKGMIRCDAPFLGEFSQQTCIYAKSIIERRETRWRDGKSETHTTIERSTERHAPFYVEDDSGRVLVRGEGADVDSILVFDQSGNDTTSNLISLATGLLGGGNFDRRFKEYTLGSDIPVYVLGSVNQGGSIGAAPSNAKQKQFIITHKSEEARASSSNTTSIVLLVIAIILAIVTVGALYAAVKYK